jgi:SSS family solute:Na+ symporter
MTDSLTWLFIFVMLYWAYCFFWGIRAARLTHTASDFFLAGRNLSPWVSALAITAVSLAGWTFMAQPGLIFRDGFQFVSTSYYAIVVPLAGVVLLRRQWMLGRRFGYMTAGEMFSDYFKSDALRLISVGIALLFGVPFVAILFGASGFLISEITDQAISRNVAMWILSAFVLFYCVTGGMQAVAKIAVVQCVLFALGASIIGLYALNIVGGFDALNIGLSKVAQNLSGLWGSTDGNGGGSFPGYFAIPGVIQWTAGLGVEAPAGGPWTAIMVLTFMMSVMGIQASPGFTMWGFASQSPRGFAIHQVWGAAFCVGLIMFVFVTIQGVSAILLGANAEVNEAGMATAQVLPEISVQQSSQLVTHFIKLMGDKLPWIIGFLAVCAIAALQATGAAFMSTTGSILTRDIFKQYLEPDASHEKQIMVGRLCTGLVFLAAMLLATFSMEATILLSGLAIACAFQLWPSLLGVTWFPWITRQAATLGLIAGIVAVVLTESIGQKITGNSLPWGRWPWTIHSAAWGMFFNIIICLMVSALTRHDENREHREHFHAFLHEYGSLTYARRWTKSVAWIIVMVWMFFAIGPGTVIGNILFGEPNAGYEAWTLGMPSIWAWQIIWWALGVGMIWYLANKVEMSAMPKHEIKEIPDCQ